MDTFLVMTISKQCAPGDWMGPVAQGCWEMMASRYQLSAQEISAALPQVCVEMTQGTAGAPDMSTTGQVSCTCLLYGGRILP